MRPGDPPSSERPSPLTPGLRPIPGVVESIDQVGDMVERVPGVDRVAPDQKRLGPGAVRASERCEAQSVDVSQVSELVAADVALSTDRRREPVCWLTD